MIYYEDYYIDNAGKQIYEPNTSAIVIYSDDDYVNAAFEKIRLNLTLEEIYQLSAYDELEEMEKIGGLLTKSELEAIQAMPYDELYAAYISLVYAAENYGCADYNPAEASRRTAEATTPYMGDKTDMIYGDKTEAATDSPDKAETYSEITTLPPEYVK